MGKRIRHPKNKIKEEQNIKTKDENKEEQKTHFVLNVHNSVVGGKSNIGN